MGKRQVGSVLNAVFSSLNNRYNALFMRKLFMYSDSQPTSDDGNIRHYDLECQGAHILVSFLQTKVITTLLESFDALKHHQRTSVRSVTRGAPSSPSQMYLSQISTPKSRMWKQQPSTRCFLRKSRGSERLSSTSQEIDTSLSSLMIQKQKMSQVFVNSPTQTQCRKKDRIISQINELERDLSQLLEQETQSTIVRSNVTSFFSCRPKNSIILRKIKGYNAKFQQFIGSRC